MQPGDAGAAGASRSAQPTNRVDPHQSRQRPQSQRRDSRRLDQQRSGRRWFGQRDAVGARGAFCEGEAEDEAVSVVRLARWRREGTVGLGVCHRSPADPTRFRCCAAEHGHGRPRGGERSVRGKPELSPARRLTSIVDRARQHVREVE